MKKHSFTYFTVLFLLLSVSILAQNKQEKEQIIKKYKLKELNNLKEKSKKIATIYVRSSPIMETLTGIMIAILIFYSGKLVIKNEIDVNNFFSFLAAMMLAYQPVRSLATLHMGISQGLSAARRILPVIDIKNKIEENLSLIHI